MQPTCRLLRRVAYLLAITLSGTGLQPAIALAEDNPIDVAFKAKVDDSEQRYVLLLPKEFKANEKHDVLIALHGHGSDRWQFVKDGRDECRGSREVAAKHHMIFVSPDYRARTSWMGPQPEADMVQIIGELKEKYRVRRVIISGGSMGGSSALTFAALHPELVQGVASLNGTANHLEYSQFQDAISASFGGAKTAIPAEYKKRSAEYWPEKFTFPVGMTTGGRDTLVPPQSCQRLADVLKKLGREVLIIHREDGGHSTNLADTQAVLEYVIQHARSPE